MGFDVVGDKANVAPAPSDVRALLPKLVRLRCAPDPAVLHKMLKPLAVKEPRVLTVLGPNKVLDVKLAIPTNDW